MTGTGTDPWYENMFIQHRVKNMLRRGWMLKTYNDGKLLKGRIKTGEKIENDDMDIISPVGLVSHVKPGDKVEAFTMDVGGDPTRRVIMMVIGDREQHPQPDEGEIFTYAPGDKKVHTRIKMKRNGQERSNDNSGRTKESGREDGVHTDGDDLNISDATKGARSLAAEKGIGAESTQGNFTVRAGANTQMEAGQHIRKGETHREGTMYVEGVIHTGDVVAGGGTSISTPRAGGKEYGTTRWNASGRQGQVSLIQTALQVVGLGGQLGDLSGLLNMFQQSQGQQNQQNNEQIQELMRRVAALEAIIAGGGG